MPWATSWPWEWAQRCDRNESFYWRLAFCSQARPYLKWEPLALSVWSLPIWPEGSSAQIIAYCFRLRPFWAALCCLWPILLHEPHLFRWTCRQAFLQPRLALHFSFIFCINNETSHKYWLGVTVLLEIKTQNLSLSYGSELIIDRLNFEIPKEKITILIGSNGSGKSTLLRAICRLLTPASGAVFLDGKDIFALPTKQVAKSLSILPQSPIVPEGLTVQQLVRQGRYPHQSWLQQWSVEDEQIVNGAIEAAGMADVRERSVDSLSGGQRQRAWIAMTLAQEADALFLDEPTTYLDLAHQIEVLDLLYELNCRDKRTIVMVLHDLNLACRYAHHIVAIHNKGVYAYGQPEDIIDEAMIKNVFGLDCQVSNDPIFHTPLIIPIGRKRKPQNIDVG